MSNLRASEPRATTDVVRNGAALRGFDAPTPLDALQSLARVAGPAEALSLWAAASEAADVHGMVLDSGEHVRLVEHLVGSAKGAARAAAISHLTRLRAHRILAAADV